MRRIKIVWCFIISIGVLMLSSQGHAENPLVSHAARQELLRSGQEIYQSRCSGCHGLQGDGKGPASPFLDPKPRDFTAKTFKFKSTATGMVPLESDLLRTIEQGIPGTSMPSFALLSKAERKALVAVILDFAKISWDEVVKVQAVTIPPKPQNVFNKKTEFLMAAGRGKKLFVEMGCSTCHGDKGFGDGVAVEGLMDNWGNPIRPANFTKPFIKRGYNIDDVAKSITLGVDGTPMPSFLEIVSQPGDIWDLAAFVFYLRGEAHGIYEEGTIEPITTATEAP